MGILCVIVPIEGGGVGDGRDQRRPRVRLGFFGLMTGNVAMADRRKALSVDNYRPTTVARYGNVCVLTNYRPKTRKIIEYGSWC